MRKCLATNQQVQFRSSEREDSLGKGQFSRPTLATGWADSLTYYKHTVFAATLIEDTGPARKQNLTSNLGIPHYS